MSNTLWRALGDGLIDDDDDDDDGDDDDDDDDDDNYDVDDDGEKEEEEDDDDEKVASWKNMILPNLKLYPMWEQNGQNQSPNFWPTWLKTYRLGPHMPI